MRPRISWGPSMKFRTVILLVGASLAVNTVLAETVVVDDKVAIRESSTPRPSRGMRMAQVEQKFGAPVTKHATVGEPPITRWDYAGFAVFFEHDMVIHAVVTGNGAAAEAPAPTTTAQPSP
jgi:hypothetical protein